MTFIRLTMDRTDDTSEEYFVFINPVHIVCIEQKYRIERRYDQKEDSYFSVRIPAESEVSVSGAGVVAVRESAEKVLAMTQEATTRRTG